MSDSFKADGIRKVLDLISQFQGKASNRRLSQRSGTDVWLESPRAILVCSASDVVEGRWAHEHLRLCLINSGSPPVQIYTEGKEDRVLSTRSGLSIKRSAKSLFVHARLEFNRGADASLNYIERHFPRLYSK